MDSELHLLNKNIQDVIFKQDKDLNITYVSPSVRKVFGYTVEEAMRLKLPKLMTRDSLKKAFTIYDEMSALAIENKNLDIPLMEYEYIRKDGTTFWGELKVTFLYDSNGDIDGSMGILRNITKRKKYQDLLKLSENRYREAFNRAEFYKNLFTHDMTNILQTIRSYAELTQILLESLDSNLIKEYMDKIEEQTLRGSNLISNIKTLFQLDETKTKLKEIDIIDLISKISKYIKDTIREKDVKIKINHSKEKFKVKSDDLLFDVFENLLLNSIK
jgi:PAS domain S-box-containing protein